MLFAVCSSCKTLCREWMAVRVTKGKQQCCIESVSIQAVRRVGWIHRSCLTTQQPAVEPMARLDWVHARRRRLSQLLPDQLSHQSNVTFLLAYRAVSLVSQWPCEMSAVRFYKVKLTTWTHCTTVGMGFDSFSSNLNPLWNPLRKSKILTSLLINLARFACRCF